MTPFFLAIVLIIFTATGLYFYLFYPQQVMPVGEKINIQTPDPEKYHNDCLHPCIRYIEDGFLGHKWWMVQSPYYNRNNKLENPILYFSDDTDHPVNWKPLCIIRDTPEAGFNSDPVIYYEKNKLWIFWREKNTPFCSKFNIVSATRGVYTTDGKNFSAPKLYLSEKSTKEDKELCPILIKRNSRYYFYAVYYQYKPSRKGLGIAIWEGDSLEEPNFKLIGINKINIPFTCDKYKQLQIKQNMFFLPKPLRHDIWHFDLFEYKNKLYMVSVAEWGDNIMLGASSDFINFRIKRKPLINCHYSNQKYYYKPTGFLRNEKLYVYYTARSKNDTKKNDLYYSVDKTVTG